MSDIVITIDLINLIVGSWDSLVEELDSKGSKMYKYKYKGSNSNPFKRPIINDNLIPKHCIIDVDVAVLDDKLKSGQYKQGKIIIPTPDMKGINYDETPFAKMLKGIEQQSLEALSDNRRLKGRVFFLEKELERAISKSSLKKHSEDNTKICPNCKSEVTIEELKNSGGVCPNCHKMINRMYGRGV